LKLKGKDSDEKLEKLEKQLGEIKLKIHKKTEKKLGEIHSNSDFPSLGSYVIFNEVASR